MNLRPTPPGSASASTGNGNLGVTLHRQQQAQQRSQQYAPIETGKPSASWLEQTWLRIYLAVRIYTQSRLQNWGRFVATRQVTVLCLCSVFLCGLTYPVLSLYAWGAPSTGSDFFNFLRTSPAWNLLAAYDGRPVPSTARDLRFPWHDLDAIVTNSEEACWQRIPKFREVTVQQVLLGFPTDGAVASEHGVLDRRVLHTLHKLEHRLHDALSSGTDRYSYGIPQHNAYTPMACAKLDFLPSGKCFTVSPMAYWNGNENAMLSDTSLIATVNSAEKHYHDFPLRHDSLFAGRVQSGSTMRKSDYAVVTLFLEEYPDHSSVVRLVNSIGRDLGLIPVGKPTASRPRFVMKHVSDVRVRSKAWEDVFFYIGYVIVGLYIYMTLRGIDKVHSRTGLVLTGLVQMLISGMGSLSLCALAGYKIDLVPWKLIPFLIVVLGVDNMFVLISAVTETSINLPVKERIAQGLGQSGTSIFVNLVAELVGLYLLYAGIPTRVIREMVVFGAVALVMDYIMEMTYFVTVLSIDMQRLELADLIHQDLRQPVVRPGSNTPKKPSTFPRLFESIFSSLRQRKARTYTGIILILSNYLLYLLYGPDYFVPAFCSNITFPDGPRLAHVPGTPWPASEVFWHLLGARTSEAVHVHIASPIVLHFTAGAGKTQTALQAILETAYAFIKFVALPISVTTFALYTLLRQLLKGSERLTADESSSAATLAIPDAHMEPGATFMCTLPEPRRSADIELLTSTSDNSAYALWVPIEHQIVFVPGTGLRSERMSRLRIPLRKILARGEVLLSLALTDSAEFCATVTSANRLLCWRIEESPTLIHFTNVPINVTKYSSIFTVLGHSFDDISPPRPVPNGSSTPSVNVLFTIQQSGAVHRWSCESQDCTEVLPPPPAPSRSTLIEGKSKQPTHILQQNLTTGSTQLLRLHSSLDWQLVSPSALSEHSKDNIVQAVWVLGQQTLLAVGRASGTVEVWDASGDRLIYTSNLATTSIRRVRLIGLHEHACEGCGLSLGEGVLLLASTSSALYAIRITTISSLDTCVCHNASPLSTFSENINGGAYYRGASPQLTTNEKRGTLSPASYPLSPHSLRRLSHASEKRKTDDLASHRNEAAAGQSMTRLSSTQEDLADDSCDTSGTFGSSASPRWRAVTIGTLTLDDKGAWDICDSQVVGVRRQLSAPKSTMLGRWELWTYSLNRAFLVKDGNLSVQCANLQVVVNQSSLPQTPLPDSGKAIPSDPKPVHPQLPIDRIRHFKPLAGGQMIVAAFGNLLVTLMPKSHSPTTYSNLRISRTNSRVPSYPR